MKKVLFATIILTIASLLMSSCAPAAPATQEAQTIIETVIVEGTPQVVEKVVTATPEPVNKEGGVLTWGLPLEPQGFNPILNNNYTELYPIQVSSQPLTWGGENFPTETRPILLDSSEVSEDGLVWTLHLKQGIKWSDGVDFTADDVLYWAQAIQDPTTTGAEWLYPHFYTGEDPYVFEKVDAYTVTVTTKEPVKNLLREISVPVIPAHYFVDNNIANKDMVTDKYNTDMNLGIGPFVVTEYRRGEAVLVERNENYYGEKALLDQIVYKVVPEPQAMVTALQTGEVDLGRINLEYAAQLVGNPDLNINVWTMDSQRGVLINTGKPMLKDVRTRQALMYAFDRRSMIKTQAMGYGVIADNLFNPVVTAYEPQTQYEFDPEKAKALLAEVGWVAGADGILVAENVEGVEKGTRFSIRYTYTQTSDPYPTLVQSFLKNVGIEVTQEYQDSATWSDLNTGKEEKDFDLSTNGFGFVGSDASGYARYFAAGDVAKCSTSYFNAEVQDLFDQAKVADDAAQADELYKQAAQILWEELPYIPVSYNQWIVVSNKRVHFEEANLNTSLFSFFENPEKLWVEK